MATEGLHPPEEIWDDLDALTRWYLSSVSWDSIYIKTHGSNHEYLLYICPSCFATTFSKREHALFHAKTYNIHVKLNRKVARRWRLKKKK